MEPKAGTCPGRAWRVMSSSYAGRRTRREDAQVALRTKVGVLGEGQLEV